MHLEALGRFSIGMWFVIRVRDRDPLPRSVCPTMYTLSLFLLSVYHPHPGRHPGHFEDERCFRISIQVFHNIINDVLSKHAPLKKK